MSDQEQGSGPKDEAEQPADFQAGGPMHQVMMICHGREGRENPQEASQRIMELLKEIESVTLVTFLMVAFQVIELRKATGEDPCAGCVRTRSSLLCELATRLGDARIIGLAIESMRDSRPEPQEDQPQSPALRRNSRGETLH